MMNNDLLKNRKILAVDDETDVLDILQEQFDPLEIVTASSYEEAERLLSEQRFDLALLE